MFLARQPALRAAALHVHRPPDSGCERSRGAPCVAQRRHRGRRAGDRGRRHPLPRVAVQPPEVRASHRRHRVAHGRPHALRRRAHHREGRGPPGAVGCGSAHAERVLDRAADAGPRDDDTRVHLRSGARVAALGVLVIPPQQRRPQDPRRAEDPRRPGQSAARLQRPPPVPRRAGDPLHVRPQPQLRPPGGAASGGGGAALRARRRPAARSGGRGDPRFPGAVGARRRQRGRMLTTPVHGAARRAVRVDGALGVAPRVHPSDEPPWRRAHRGVRERVPHVVDRRHDGCARRSRLRRPRVAALRAPHYRRELRATQPPQFHHRHAHAGVCPVRAPDRRAQRPCAARCGRGVLLAASP
jgi:hypothetical protein